MNENENFEEYLKFIKENNYGYVKTMIDHLGAFPGMKVTYPNGIIYDEIKYKNGTESVPGSEPVSPHHIDVVITTPFKDTEFHVEVWNRECGYLHIIKLIRKIDGHLNYRRYFCLEWIPTKFLQTSMYGCPKSDSCLDIYHVSDMLRYVSEAVNMDITKGDETNLLLELASYNS